MIWSTTPDGFHDYVYQRWYEYTGLRHRSGEYRWVIGRAQCVRDEEGRITRWYGTCTDIHDLKIAEETRQLLLRN